LAVTDWRLRRWRLWFLALSNAPQFIHRIRGFAKAESPSLQNSLNEACFSGVLSNLQSFFDVIRDNLDSLEAMSPEERASFLSELPSPNELEMSPSLDLLAPSSALTQPSQRTQHPPNATGKKKSKNRASVSHYESKI